MNITKEILESKGFVLTDYMGMKSYAKKIAAGTHIRFGGQFNGACELCLPDGNDGEITLVPSVESWEDVEALERLFKRAWIDTGHTLTANFDDEDEIAEGSEGREGA